ncbi:NAD-specific glutamate dehydrogenase [Cellvibrio zantedeschiae]|uniref:NAD-specific glutamate dehydrogenase n=1 Tax=Cellvibrio zantedeschiae TaxID=1237077 RepID=A0ABQ3B0Z9_9GAMM|nr:NAD-glutamate dehydrogenase [Cellvibrio zantedeschiae]GGY70203.1 NAD-specific glutamate dehydrogenase [Cellvibrio zantedeschiae]
MNSQLAAAQDLTTFVQDLHNFAREKIPEAELPGFMKFVESYFSRFPLEELAGRYLGDLFGSVYQWWRYIQHFDGQHPKVSLVNPKLDTEGWVCPHTVLVVHQTDMPFLVDSIRIELNRRNIAIHAIKSTVLNIQRDSKHQLVDILNRADTETSGTKEAFVYLEINLLTQKSELESITQSLMSVLAELSVVVSDFQPMLNAVAAAEENLSHATKSVAVANVAESQEFLAWLRDNNFTFLGYSEYEFGEEQGKKFLREKVEKRLGLFAYKGGEANYSESDNLNPGMARFHLAPQVLTFSKSAVKSRIHRQAYSDYIVVKQFNALGDVVGEMRFLGLYTSSVYTMMPTKIPVIRNKVNKVFERSGLSAKSHDGKSLQQILTTFPRDELFLSNSSELFETVTAIAQINERYMVRLFMRRDPFGKFVSCLVYVPRDVFTTQMRLRIQDVIGQAINATESEFNTYFSESILARVHLVFKVDPKLPLEYNQEKLERQIREISRSWEDHLQNSLIESLGEEKAMRLLQEYRDAFSSSYKEHFESRTAVHDIASMAELNTPDDIAMSFYQPVGAEPNVVRFKVFRKTKTIELSDAIPLLENLGLRVLSENPYAIHKKSEGIIWLHDFQLSYNLPGVIDVLRVKDIFQEAFSAAWHKKTVNDSFNKLVLSAELSWREVFVLRAYAGYMHQTLFNFTQHYIANALVNHRDIARLLIKLFSLKFNPNANADTRAAELNQCRELINTHLNAVENLSEDRILRRFLVLIDGSLRTNYYQVAANGAEKDYLSIKLSPRSIPEIPEPRPLYEIYVYSLRVEGVHLRGGKVARGGLRWSDRLQDYRTEVLGLVKAQQVKNAVIVPNGAKGGFVCKQPPLTGGREAVQQEGIACYKVFIRGLLDLTDNLVDGKLVPPNNVVRYDEDDPYLVVAADKGTATFSDIANSISAEYSHWLGDAFASGGSQGYDHKGMGITARGAWISVMRHFREKNINIQKEDFTVVGIGDMAGDVFGNGMLLSEHICLLAAFNHVHIFIDPTPDSAKSFVERQRLFNTPKTSWMDYEKSLISKGGGIFSRDAKTIAVTPEMKTAFNIYEDNLTPAELISSLLKAPVDLIWNGGIGTYVKASSETHADVGDKANDSLRINGNELRCKVFGEGGNLGMTQRGRIEYALNGGACNTDFIDNAGGVDCSDHEVNVKILLNEVVSNGDLTPKQRNQLLANMTDNVADLVLKNNYRQTQAISIAELESLARGAEYRRFMSTFESQKRLNRKLEFLPADDILVERQSHNLGLTRPELAVLISYAKAVLKEDLAIANIADDSYVAKAIEGAFPNRIATEYRESLYAHRLKREIVATQIANDMVNNMGISFAQRLVEATGATVGEVAKAYVAARDVYQMEKFIVDLQALDHQIPAKIQYELMINMMRRVRRATRWFLRNRRSNINPAAEVEFFAPAVSIISQQLPQLLLGGQLEELQGQYQRLQESGVPQDLIIRATSASYLFSGLSIGEASRRSNREMDEVAELYFALSEALSLPWFANQIANLKVETFWQAMARETYMDDLESQLRSLTISLIKFSKGKGSVTQVVEAWSQQQALLINRWKLMVNELQAASGTDFAVFSVALRELLDLAQATQHCDVTL